MDSLLIAPARLLHTIGIARYRWLYSMLRPLRKSRIPLPYCPYQTNHLTRSLHITEIQSSVSVLLEFKIVQYRAIHQVRQSAQYCNEQYQREICDDNHQNCYGDWYG